MILRCQDFQVSGKNPLEFHDLGYLFNISGFYREITLNHTRNELGRSLFKRLCLIYILNSKSLNLMYM